MYMPHVDYSYVSRPIKYNYDFFWGQEHFHHRGDIYTRNNSYNNFLYG